MAAADKMSIEAEIHDANMIGGRRTVALSSSSVDDFLSNVNTYISESCDCKPITMESLRRVVTGRLDSLWCDFTVCLLRVDGRPAETCADVGVTMSAASHRGPLGAFASDQLAQAAALAAGGPSSAQVRWKFSYCGNRWKFTRVGTAGDCTASFDRDTDNVHWRDGSRFLARKKQLEAQPQAQAQEQAQAQAQAQALAQAQARAQAPAPAPAQPAPESPPLPAPATSATAPALASGAPHWSVDPPFRVGDIALYQKPKPPLQPPVEVKVLAVHPEISRPCFTVLMPDGYEANTLLPYLRALDRRQQRL